MKAPKITSKSTLEWAKIVGIIVVAWIVIKQFLNIGKLFTKITTGSIFGTSDEELAAQQEQAEGLVDAVKPGSNLSYSDSWYGTAATQLEDAMQGWGTSTTKIDAVIDQLKTTDDAKKLFVKFGARKNEDFGNSYGHLMQWFGWELSNLPMPLGDPLTVAKIKVKFKDTGISLPW